MIVNPPFINKLPKDYLHAKKIMRKLACKLESSYKTLLIFKPNKKDIVETIKNLIWLSNAIGQTDKTGEVNWPLMADGKINEIRKLLKTSYNLCLPKREENN